jgi:hypothetical protein
MAKTTGLPQVTDKLYQYAVLIFITYWGKYLRRLIYALNILMKRQ